MSKLEDILNPNEKVLWKDKPSKKPYLLQVLGGIIFGIVCVFGFLFLQYLEQNIPSFLLLIVGIVVMVIPPLYYLSYYPKMEYILTNQRIISKSEHTRDNSTLDLLEETLKVPKRKTWFIDHNEIKKIIVKEGKVWDKIVGTATIYFLTPAFPYLPETHIFITGDHDYPNISKRLENVYNAVTEEYKEIPAMVLVHNTANHPRFSAIKEPYVIEKLFRDTIFGIE